MGLTFEYQPGTTVLTGQGEKATADGTPDDDGESYILVNNGDLFAGTVQAEAMFTLAGDFGSNTVLEIFDDLAAFQAGQSPLQTLQYHTSCSQPIQLGDLVGSVALVGYQGETGSASRPSGLGDPADSPTGPTVLFGEEVVFFYEVTNRGNVGLVNVAVSDSLLGSIDDRISTGNFDDVLDPGETWVFSVSTTADEAGQRVNVGSVKANSIQAPSGATLTASDPAYHFVETLKFFVVDKEDYSYTYTESGNPIGRSATAQGNSDARGVAADQSAQQYWVVDKDKSVYVYGADGSFAGSWKAQQLGGEAEGIAVHPDPIKPGLWIVDRNKKAVFYYAEGKTQLSGELPATSSFSLNLDDKIDTKNDHPKGITTDGVSLWVVDDDGGREKVFKYDMDGKLLGSWEIGDSELEEPRGITVDPAGGSTIWIVDKKSDQVYQFDNATGVTAGTETSDALFALAANNSNPEGIADPPPGPPDTSLPSASVDGVWRQTADANWAAEQALVPLASLRHRASDFDGVREQAVAAIDNSLSGEQPHRGSDNEFPVDRVFRTLKLSSPQAATDDLATPTDEAGTLDQRALLRDRLLR